MLVTFEGQDGAGKSALLTAVRDSLAAHDIPAVAVAEFSDSPYGQRLVDAVGGDKFLRPVPNEAATVLTRALEIAADLYYFDEYVIAPALRRGAVALKDRHLDTILYTLVPTLLWAGAIEDEERALAWLRGMLQELRCRPDLTVLVTAPLAVRRQRITERMGHAPEAHGDKVSATDLAVFAARERLLSRLHAEEPRRFLTVENGERPLQEGVSKIVEAIRAQRSAASRKGE